MDQNELLHKLTAELKTAEQHHPFIRIDLGVAEAFSLLAHLQLALRHPMNHGEAAERMFALAQRLATAISALGPACTLAVAQGWNPQFDVHQEEEQ
jgi:hypothetical protein